MNLKYIYLAMNELKNLACGGIGENGASQEELNDAIEKGMCCYDDSDYHTVQQAWIYLNEFLKENNL
jgi:hypothetical protein